MHVIIGKQKCIQCDELKNLLDEKGIQYNYSDITEMQYNYWDMTEIPHETVTYL
jgi:glutaredoxin